MDLVAAGQGLAWQAGVRFGMAGRGGARQGYFKQSHRAGIGIAAYGSVGLG